MDYKIKPTIKLKLFFLAALGLIFLGGIVSGISIFYNNVVDLTMLILGVVAAVIGSAFLFLVLGIGDSSMLEIDVDSFTESAIKEGVEKRLKELKSKL